MLEQEKLVGTLFFRVYKKGNKYSTYVTENGFGLDADSLMVKWDKKLYPEPVVIRNPQYIEGDNGG